MSSAGKPRRRPSVQITEARAARLHRLVRALAEQPLRREPLLDRLAIGLRTFYRELELLRRFGIRIRQIQGEYTLSVPGDQAEGLLPFPDPKLSFAEMRELARGQGPAAIRLAESLERVLEISEAKPTSRKRPANRKARARK